MVSVIIPTHNRQHTLPLVLASLKRQTYPHWQCFIIDDNSTDDTANLIEAHRRDDERFVCHKTPIDRHGANAARNLGLRESFGCSYVLFLDSDDALADFCLQERVAEMEARPDLDYGVWPTLLFDSNPGDSTLLWNVSTSEEDLDRFLSLDIPWQTAGAFWRRTALEKVGPWNETLPSWQDWEFHLRALAMGLRYQKFEKPDCYWRTPRNDSTWEKSYQVDHLTRRRSLLVEIEDMLRREGKWGERQKKLMVGLYFWHARLWYSKMKKRFTGLAEWHRAWRRGLVATRPYLEGCRWFSKMSRGSAKDPRALFQEWPPEYLTGSSKTFQSIHYYAP